MKKIVKSLFLSIFIFISLNFTYKFVSADNDYWYRVWGGDGHDECIGIALDSSNNVYLGGIIESTHLNYNLCLVKYDNAGNYQWNKTINGISHLGGKIRIDSSDNIFLAGEIYNPNSSSYDFIVIKYDSSGNYQWNKTWGGELDERCYTMILDSLGNIYLAGSSFTELNYEDFCLVKLDNMGNYLWNRTWGGSKTDICWDITVNSLDDILLVGDTESFREGNRDMCLVSYNSTGDLQWFTTWGDFSSDFGRAIVLDPFENIYLAGTSYNGDYPDFSLVKFDNLGNFQWNRTWGSGNTYENCYSMLIKQEQDLYLAGTKGDQFCIVVFNTNGTFQWSRSINLYDGGYISGIIMDNQENTYIGGCVYATASNLDFLLIKNLQLFPDQQINGYNIFLFTVMIGVLLFLSILKTKFLDKKKNLTIRS